MGPQRPCAYAWRGGEREGGCENGSFTLYNKPSLRQPEHAEDRRRIVSRRFDCVGVNALMRVGYVRGLEWMLRV